MELTKILIEALPYIKKFKEKIFVIKYGGKVIGDENLEFFCKDIELLWEVGIKTVVVHGGGRYINQILQKANLESHFKDGERITTREVLDYVIMGLSKVREEIVGCLVRNGAKAVGISGSCGELIEAQREKEYSGKVKKINPQIIYDLLNQGYIVVLSPFGFCKEEGVYVNINADTVAGELAAQLKAEKLIILTDVEGIYYKKDNSWTLISSITIDELKKLMQEGIIEGGMIPKVRGCIVALERGVKKAHIISQNLKHSLLIEIFTDKGIGTQIGGGMYPYDPP